MSWLYLTSLLVSIGCLTTLDRRYRLAFWSDARRTWWTMLISVGIFIVWDLLGIGLGIFRHGGGQFALPYRIVPEFPIEELFFLFLLCYVTLLLYRGAGQWRRT